MSGFNEHIKPSVDGETRIVVPEGYDEEAYWTEKKEAAEKALRYAQSQLSRIALRGMEPLDPDWS